MNQTAINAGNLTATESEISTTTQSNNILNTPGQIIIDAGNASALSPAAPWSASNTPRFDTLKA